jgi:hypothetical protein
MGYGWDYRRFIALGNRLNRITEFNTMGVKPNFLDYSSYQRELILVADIILCPTLNYSQFFTTIGMKIFSNIETYLYADEKIKQTIREKLLPSELAG